jgi:4-amino-4-deoxy-L-arabinose transferase-like glycosyltransferase
MIKTIKKHFVTIILFSIIILGGFLRIYNLGGSPPSLNWDEAAFGYNAYSVSKTLKDEYGKILPVFTRSFDEYKSALPLYLIIPSINIFGINEFGIRFPSAFIGTLSILLIFLLTKEIFDKKAALLAAFVFSIEPWSVHLSRINYESTEAMFFLLLGFLLYIFSKKKNKLLPFSVVSFMISMFTYNSNKVLVPIFIILLIIINWKELLRYPKKIINISLIILAIFVAPFVILAIAGQSFARVTYTNIFILWANELSPKIYYFIWDVVGRYISYFSPYNLFIRESQEPATIIAGNSIFYVFEFIPLVIGFIYLLKNSKKYKDFLVLLLISPFPATATWNFFQPGRTMSLFACYSILIGVGLYKIINIFPKLLQKILISTLVLFSLLNAFYLMDSINVYLPVRDGGNWQSEFRYIVPVVMQYADKYDQVIINTPQAQPYIFYLFYGKYDPAKYLKELDLTYIGTPRKHYDFGKFHFRTINWNEDKNIKNTLFVGKQTDFFGVDPLVDIKDKSGVTINYLVGTK